MILAIIIMTNMKSEAKRHIVNISPGSCEQSIKTWKWYLDATCMFIIATDFSVVNSELSLDPAFLIKADITKPINSRHKMKKIAMINGLSSFGIRGKMKNRNPKRW